MYTGTTLCKNLRPFIFICLTVYDFLKKDELYSLRRPIIQIKITSIRFLKKDLRLNTDIYDSVVIKITLILAICPTRLPTAPAAPLT